MFAFSDFIAALICAWRYRYLFVLFALTKNVAERFEAEKVDISDISGTPNEVLREILDVGSNLPVWVEREIDNIISQASNIPTDDRARFVMSRLAELGISDSIVEYQTEGTR